MQSLMRLTAWGGLAALLVSGLGRPAQAAYTKLYSFSNSTGVSQKSVKATTNGLESITAHTSTPSGWSPVKTGTAVISGAYNTTLTFGSTSVATPVGGSVTVGWTTADTSCRLRDLRWGGGQVVVPTQLGGVPGGGMVFYDYPDSGCLTVVVSNDTPEPLSLSGVEYGIVNEALAVEDLAGLVGAGAFVELRVAAIDHDIDTLRAEVAYYGSLGALPSPSVRSLVAKLDRAAAYKHEGLDAYLGGNQAQALVLWDKAAKQITNFISEVTAAKQKGNLAASLYTRWVVDGGGEITTAPEIRDALLALPNGPPLQSFPPLPAGTPLPSYAGLDPANYQPWPVTGLQPGEYTAFVVCGMNLGSGFIMGGSVVDASGFDWLDWVEQGVAEPFTPDTQPPVIISASATPAYLWSPDHTLRPIALEVTVEDDTYAVWYVAGVASNQPENGTGDGDYAPDWWVDPDDPQSLWLRAERSGSDPTETRWYTITLQAIDTGGNLSAPYELLIPVSHDQG